MKLAFRRIAREQGPCDMACECRPWISFRHLHRLALGPRSPTAGVIAV